MKMSKYKKQEIEEKIKQAKELYKTGLSTRAVGKVVGRSHEWVAKKVKGLDKS